MDGRFLTQAEFEQLVYLLGLLNDPKVTQVDHDEADELHRLLHRLQHDGEHAPA